MRAACGLIEGLCEPTTLIEAGFRGLAVLAALALGVLAAAAIRRPDPIRPILVAGMAGVIGLFAATVSSRGAGDTLLAVAGFGSAASIVGWLVVRRPGGRSAGGGTQRRGLLLGAAAALFGTAAGASVAARFVWDRLLTERLRMRVERERRADDPWPRGDGAFLIGGLGAPEMEKIYLEAGGSLSPAVGSFGISFWVFSRRGEIAATSDSLPLRATRHRYLTTDAGMPAVRVETDDYDIVWELRPDGAISLDVLRAAATGRRLQLVLRSVGPAGGPLRTIAHDHDGRLLLNDRWMLTAPPAVRLVALGDERDRGWKAPSPAPPPQRHHSAEGWAHARLEIPAEASGLRVTLTDTRRTGPRPAALPAGQAVVLGGLPEAFETCIRAQVMTLLLGLVGDETRPGDPVNYPLSWQRDGAYVLVALARAGHAETAGRLAMKFATDDFFGGFGAEADAPGLSLWALEEVSAALSDPGFDSALKPHMLRKVGLVERMLSTATVMRHSFTGPVVPAYRGRPDLDLVARPPRFGLVDGRMDWHFPIFFVNAVTHAGLLAASRFAGRVGDPAGATWGAMASQLGAAWRSAYAALGPGSYEARNPRTLASGLWPGEVADPAAFASGLERNWQENRAADGHFFRQFPVWTYFDLAEAHQWLRLGRPDRCRATLDWFARHQSAPGLHGFWEGHNEENSFGRWQHTRGHIGRRPVMPHYWSAAECLLLCLAMLAHVEPRPIPTLVVGGGVARDWLRNPLTVRGIGTGAGVISWAWDPEGALTVDAPEGLALRAGPEFPTDTRIVRGAIGGAQ